MMISTNVVRFFTVFYLFFACWILFDGKGFATFYNVYPKDWDHTSQAAELHLLTTKWFVW